MTTETIYFSVAAAFSAVNLGAAALNIATAVNLRKSKDAFLSGMTAITRDMVSENRACRNFLDGMRRAAEHREQAVKKEARDIINTLRAKVANPKKPQPHYTEFEEIENL